MGDEIVKTPKETIEVPEIVSARQALSLLYSVFEFFFTNYKYTTFMVIGLMIFLAVQFTTNFQQVKQIASVFGL
jgi:hypothetical protein